MESKERRPYLKWVCKFLWKHKHLVFLFVKLILKLLSFFANDESECE